MKTLNVTHAELEQMKLVVRLAEFSQKLELSMGASNLNALMRTIRGGAGWQSTALSFGTWLLC